MDESGTGKEVLAQYIFAKSNRIVQSFVTVNCAAIPENLLEAELFGYKKGAFTGAYQHKKGRFQDANGGLIFLDEIGEIPLAVQSKLLRILQAGEVSPLQIPSLRQRPEDLHSLISHFIALYCKKNKKSNLSLSADALKLIENYSRRFTRCAQQF